MGYPGAVLDQSFDVENEIRELHDEVLKERHDRMAAEAAMNQDLRQLADLLSDNNAAAGYAIKYLNGVDAQYTAKEAMMQDAIREFNVFLNLPEKSNNYLAIWDMAFSVLSTVVPAFRLTAMFSEIEAASKIETAAAKAFMKTPHLMARVTMATVKGHDIADVIAKGNDIRGKMTQLAGSSQSVNPDLTSKSRIHQLIKESNDAHQKLDKAIDALDVEFTARIQSLLYRVPYPSKKGTLLDMAKRLLPSLPNYFTDDELEDVGQRYKWEILKAWASTNVTVVFNKNVNTGDKVTIEGLNNTQQTQIMSWFGLSVPRGKYTSTPKVLNIFWVLTAWGVREVIRAAPPITRVS
jgi:hypothetical protein